VKIVTWNVNGIRAREKQLLEWLEIEQPDVLCLQELKASPEQVPQELRDLQRYWCYWHGERAYSGVGLLINRAVSPAKPEFSHPSFDHETRIVTARIGDHLVIGSVYVPNGGKDYAAKIRFLQAMEQYAAECQERGIELVLCGDINVTRTEMDVHPKERRPNTIGQLPEERELFEKILGDRLVDVGRALDPRNDGLFTWWPPWRNMRQKNIGWRLDYVLASPGIAERIHSCAVLAQVGTSDHAPVLAVLAG
jgi:exodeoxyribonuclease-3